MANMTNHLHSTANLCAQLQAAWGNKNRNLADIGKQLDVLKEKLTENSFAFLPAENAAASSQEIMIARNTLEIGAQWAIEMKDVETFERYMAQLKCYYLDYKDDASKDSVSPYTYHLFGLNLLRLLAQNKLADFHTELELLPMEVIQTNAYIIQPVKTEQYLMEGSYNKVFMGKANVPAANYSFFMDILLTTIRDEIASCLEKAYDKIALTEAQRLLYLDSAAAAKQYAQQRNWNISNDGCVYFNREESAVESISATELALRAIEYARELEMII